MSCLMNTFHIVIVVYGPLCSGRYSNLMKPMSNRKTRLMDSLDVQQLFRDVEDEEAWIREKEPIINSTNRGRDLIGVQNLIKKHQVYRAF